MVCRAGERRKEDDKQKDKRVWQIKTNKVRGSTSGTKDDKELEVNVEVSDDSLQVTREVMDANVVQVVNVDEASNEGRGGESERSEGEAAKLTAGKTSNIEGGTVNPNESKMVLSIIMSVELPKIPLQDLGKIPDNQNGVSDEECEEFWCDKENEEDLELVQRQDKEVPDVP